MKYKKELAAIQVYIDNFDPDEFTSSVKYDISLPPTPEKLADAHKLKAKFKRNRQIAESFQSMFANGVNSQEMIITQEEVDALLEGWTAENN
jgi:hypothetical protein